MRNPNLDPFWRTSIGFDRIFDLMDQSLRFQTEDNYPPCNIVRTGEDSYRITLAVAGFKPEQISIVTDRNALILAGRLDEKQGQSDYLHRGIAGPGRRLARHPGRCGRNRRSRAVAGRRAASRSTVSGI